MPVEEERNRCLPPLRCVVESNWQAGNENTQTWNSALPFSVVPTTCSLARCTAPSRMTGYGHNVFTASSVLHQHTVHDDAPYPQKNDGTLPANSHSAQSVKVSPTEVIQMVTCLHFDCSCLNNTKPKSHTPQNGTLVAMMTVPTPNNNTPAASIVVHGLHWSASPATRTVVGVVSIVGTHAVILCKFVVPQQLQPGSFEIA